MPLSRTAVRTAFPAADFADVLAANERYVETYRNAGLEATAARELAVVTCMDSRIDPLGLLGMQPGDVKILRNAGARVTEDVLRTLMLATYLLGVRRILVMPHTGCKMASGEEADIHQEIYDTFGVDTRSVTIGTIADQESALVTDIVRIRAFPLIPDDVIVAGAVYDVATGRLRPMDI